MNNKQAIEIVEQQFNDAKRWLYLLQTQQSDEEFKQATAGIHAMGTVLELAKEYLTYLEMYEQEEHEDDK